MSNLVAHAEEEMRRAGLYGENSDYGGMLPKAVMDLIKPFAASGHSGASAMMTLQLFERLARFKTLSPVTDDPTEWQDVTDMGSVNGLPLFQNKRDSSLFSHDSGVTYYSVDDEHRIVKNSQPKNGPSEDPNE